MGRRGRGDRERHRWQRSALCRLSEQHRHHPGQRETAAARALKARDWTGIVVRELLGARDLTFAEATRIIGAHIGKAELKYVQFPYADFASSLMQTGISANVAGLYAEMARAFNDGKIESREGRTPQNTTPSRLEDFAEDLARAYKAA